MSENTPLLDEAFERLAASGFELPNGFVNHGPMACEALAALGCDEAIDDWSRRFARIQGAVEPETPADFAWEESLGQYEQLPSWIGFFERAIDEEGWPGVVARWVPRLMPALVAALFHGAIRTAHAVRAVDAADTEARRTELALALGYWAARFRPGATATQNATIADTRLAIVQAAGHGARRYLTQPDILHLHGITGAMAVEILAPHLSDDAAAAGLAHVRAEHAALYRDTPATEPPDAAGPPDDDLALAATASWDPHQVKLVEACRRGYAVSADPAFVAAAETVTGRGR